MYWPGQRFPSGLENLAFRRTVPVVESTLLSTNDSVPVSETGRALGISAERVRQIENDALRRLAEVRELQGVRAAA